MQSFFPKIISLSLFLFAALSGYAQNDSSFAKATLSDGYAICKGCDPTGFVADAGGCLSLATETQTKMGQIVKGSNSTYFFNRFSPDRQLLRSTKTDVAAQFKGTENFDSRILKVGGKDYFFYAYLNPTELAHYIYCQELSVEKGTFVGLPKLCARTDYRFSKQSPFRNTAAATNPFWQVTLSPDSSKVLIYTDEWDKEKDFAQAPHSNVRVFDTGFRELWSRRIFKETLKRKGRFGVINLYNPLRELVFWKQFAVDNSGNVYGVGRFKDASENKENLPDYEYRLAKWSKDSEEPTQVSFRLEDKFTSEFQMVLNKKEEVIFMAFYTNKSSNVTSEGYATTTAGLAIAKLKEDRGTFKNQYTHMLPFLPAVLASFEGAGVQNQIAKAETRGKAPEIKNLEFKNILMGPEGHLHVCMEQFRLVQVDRNSAIGVKVPAQGYLMRVTPEGTLSWMNKIPKLGELEIFMLPGIAKISFRFTTLSFASFLGKGNVYILYTDIPANNNLTPAEKPQIYNEGDKANLVALKITPTGKVSRQVLLELDKGTRIAIVSAFQYGENKILLHAQSGTREAHVCDVVLD